MKVKIGNTIYDSEKEPIMLIMSEEDKTNIATATKVHKDGKHKFVTFPTGSNVVDIRKWMYN